MGAVGEHDPAGAALVRRLVDPAEVAGALALRERVFCGEQGVSLGAERDGRDETAVHLGAFAGGELIGTCRLLPGAGGTGDAGGAPGGTGDRAAGAGAGRSLVVVQRVSVHPDHRRRGVGRALMDAAVDEARRRGVGAVSLHAQVATERFYAGQGFTRRGRPFFEEGIEHVTMRCELEPERLS